MNDYTPEEQEFIGAWVSSHSEEGWGGPVDVEGRPRERIAEARRGIAKVKADALREAADKYAESDREQTHGVTSVLMFMHHYAARIEEDEQ